MVIPGHQQKPHVTKDSGPLVAKRDRRPYGPRLRGPSVKWSRTASTSPSLLPHAGRRGLPHAGPEPDEERPPDRRQLLLPANVIVADHHRHRTHRRFRRAHRTLSGGCEDWSPACSVDGRVWYFPSAPAATEHKGESSIRRGQWDKKLLSKGLLRVMNSAARIGDDSQSAHQTTAVDAHRIN